MKRINWFLIAFLLPLWLSAQNGNILIEAFTRSYAQEADSNYTGAINALTEVYKESSYELNLRLGWLYYVKGDHFQSIACYKKAMQQLPYAIEAKLGYVLPQAALGNWAEVEKSYLEILRIDSKNTLANYRLGVMYYQQENYEEAYKHTEIVANLYPFDYDAAVLFAWVNLRMGNTAKAKALFQKALMIYPGSASAQEGLSMIK